MKIIAALFVLITLHFFSLTKIIAMANPSSVYCHDQGYKNEIRTNTDGGQHGVCIFPNGKECEEWAFYRGECGKEYKKEPLKPVFIAVGIALAVGIVGIILRVKNWFKRKND